MTLTLSRMSSTRTAGDVATRASKLLKAQHFDLCLTDMRLPDGSGLDLRRGSARTTRDTPVAMITAFGNVEAAVRALKAGAFDFVSKPVDLGVAAPLVRTRAASSRTRAGRRRASTRTGHALSAARRRWSSCARRSRASRAARRRCTSPANRASARSWSRAPSTSRPRADGPFVPVNCGAIPAELMESEFFGHKRGSFTGAHADKAGLFQAADGGTLFLDEVAELPLHMQVKLLRVIQEKTVPPGRRAARSAGRRAHPVGHAQGPRRAGREGAFRHDLYYRINVIELRVPPLRERADDMPDLADAILRAAVAPAGHRRADADAPRRCDALRLPFPGNVRELENMLERALALCKQDGIDVERPALRAVPRAESAPPLAPDATAQLRTPASHRAAAEPRGARRTARRRRARRHRQGAGRRPATTRPRPRRRWA